jgi:hypothetical protein
MSPKAIKFRNILGELNVAKLYGGEHLGVTAQPTLTYARRLARLVKRSANFTNPHQYKHR